MAFWNSLFKKTAKPSLFSFLSGRAAPEFNSNEYYRAYVSWVYACINAIAEEVATIELHLYKKTKDGQEEVKNHICVSLLSDVNPYMTSSDLFFVTSAYSKLVGECFWYLPGGSVTKKPAEIWVLDPAKVSIARSSSNIVAGYVYRNDRGQDIPLAAEEIIHFKKFNPLNPWRGMGAVKAAAIAIDTDAYSAKWNRNWFYNAAVPSGVVSTPNELTNEQYERLKTQWEARYGGVENAHKVAVLEGGTSFTPIGFSQKDMDFIEQRRFSRDEILGIFRVPKTALGLTDDVNRANAEATDYVFAKRVIKPEMQFIADRLSEFYLPLFGLNQSEYFFGFDDPVPQNTAEERENRKAGLSSGYLTINEVRADIGVAPVVGGDVPYLPINLMPIGASLTETTHPDESKVKTKGASSHYIEKRIRFIQSQIQQSSPEFEKLLLEQKASLLKQLYQEKSVTKANLNDLLKRVLSHFDQWIERFKNPTDDTLTTVFTFAGTYALSQLDIGISFDLKNERAIQWLKDNALRHATQIVEGLKGEITTILSSGVESGMSVAEIASQIGQFYDTQSQWRALRIARTEVIDGYGAGSLEGWHQSGVVKMKEWLTAGDGNVSEECLLNEADGVIPLDATFSSGESAPPSHPNCRCTLQPVV